ncbi:MAG: uracil-xanthine permease [Kiritimatiellae bacterium]|nr:uracil-xanthine permease [Kiritimatiellia bacterium]
MRPRAAKKTFASSPSEHFGGSRLPGAVRTVALGVQHLFAMFGATMLVAVLTGLSPSATLLWAGTGTIVFHLVTRLRVPAFLGSPFAFIPGYAAMTALCGKPGFENLTVGAALQYACLGVAAGSLLYFAVAAFVKVCGVKRVVTLFPPVVTGPIIICIGLVLAPVALNSCMFGRFSGGADYDACMAAMTAAGGSASLNWCVALAGIVTVIGVSVFARGMLRVVPVLSGVAVSYLTAYLLGNVLGRGVPIDYGRVAAAAWAGLPVAAGNTVFPVLRNIDWGAAATAFAVIMPLSFAAVMEHVGDVSAISSIVGRNFFADPGLHRTLSGDGLATFLASLFGAPANTTCGENTGVLSITGVHDPRVIRVAAVIAVFISFCPKFTAFIDTVPAETIGGVSFVLYGMIASAGARNLVEGRVDFSKGRNMLIAAVILVLALGVSFSKAGSIRFSVAGVNVALSGLAAGAMAGILLNALLPGKDFVSSETAPSIKDPDRFGAPKAASAPAAGIDLTAKNGKLDGVRAKAARPGDGRNRGSRKKRRRKG